MNEWRIAQWIYQELVSAHGFTGSYQSVKRFALAMARTQCQPGRGLLVRSDHGVQYAKRETRPSLETHGWEASMSRPANPYNNACMENAIGKLKGDVLGATVPVDHATSRSQLFAGIDCWYNQRRRHSALNYKSPVAFEAQLMND